MKNIMLMVVLFCSSAMAQTIEYGNNPGVGNYLKMKDSTRIYYEVYGSGKPLVLLHGGLYGDISEYGRLIPALAKQFMVIAIGTRGHAKSEIGHKPYTYHMMAEDAYAIIQHLTKDSILLLGFSDGAVQAMDLAIHHPGLVKKMVFAGGNISAASYRPGLIEELKKLNGSSLEKDDPGFVSDRKKLMPEPQRWDEFVELLKQAWVNQVAFTDDEIKNIICPVMVTAGDRDRYNSIESFVRVYKLLPHAQLAIIPNADHIIFYRQPELMEKLVLDFLR